MQVGGSRPILRAKLLVAAAQWAAGARRTLERLADRELAILRAL
ncbi:MAG TPA: hypothetical protein VF635_10185 [Propionibacteriaceae bacterium]|jgi:hypothetical protein